MQGEVKHVFWFKFKEQQTFFCKVQTWEDVTFFVRIQGAPDFFVKSLHSFHDHETAASSMSCMDGFPSGSGFQEKTFEYFTSPKLAWTCQLWDGTRLWMRQCGARPSLSPSSVFHEPGGKDIHSANWASSSASSCQWRRVWMMSHNCVSTELWNESWDHKSACFECHLSGQGQFFHKTWACMPS